MADPRSNQPRAAILTSSAFVSLTTVARQSGWWPYCHIQKCSPNGPGIASPECSRNRVTLAIGARWEAAIATQKIPPPGGRSGDLLVRAAVAQDPLSCSIGEPAFPSRPGAARAAARNGRDGRSEATRSHAQRALSREHEIKRLGGHNVPARVRVPAVVRCCARAAGRSSLENTTFHPDAKLGHRDTLGPDQGLSGKARSTHMTNGGHS